MNENFHNSSSSGRSAAIVVTYNRKILLIRCISSLLSQEKRPDKIIIIDNFSTDGTESHLQKSGILNNPIISYINTGCNLGGAGGFAHGISLAINQGYEWIWLLDDDAVPDFLCFSKLWSYRDKDTVLCPLCVDEKNITKLAFAAPLPNSSVNITWNVDEIKNISCNEKYKDWGAFFNGTFIPSEIIKKIGNINSKMFIWGDEEEYMLRTLSQGYYIATVSSAIIKHPKERCDWVNITKNRRVIQFSSNWKIYSYYRNRGYIARKYSRSKGIFTFLMYTYYFFIKERSLIKYKFFITAWFDGYFNRYKRTLPF